MLTTFLVLGCIYFAVGIFFNIKNNIKTNQPNMAFIGILLAMLMGSFGVPYRGYGFNEPLKGFEPNDDKSINKD